MILERASFIGNGAYLWAYKYPDFINTNEFII